MHEASGHNTWQTLGLTIVAAAFLAGCSGGGPGIGAGSTTQMRRQVEAATAARMRTAKAARSTKPATKPGSAVTAKTTEPAPRVGESAKSEPAAKSKSKKGVATALPSETSPAVSPEPPPQAGTSRQVALSADGSVLAIDGEDGSIRVLETNSGSAVAAWPGKNIMPSALAIDTARHLVAAASADGPITVWHYGAQRLEGFDYFARLQHTDLDPALRGHRGRVGALGFASDGQHVVSAGDDATVRVWRLSAESPQAVAVGECTCAPAAGQGGKTMAVATDDHMVEIFNLDDVRRSRRLQRHQAPITALAFGHSKDLEVLVSADEKGRIHVWDFHTDRDQEVFGHAGPVTALAFDETRRRILSASTDGSLRIAEYPVSQSRLLATLSAPPASLALTADQQYAVLNVSPASAAVIPLAGDEPAVLSPLGGGEFTACAIARDGEVVLTGTAAGSVVCQNREDGGTMAQFVGARGAVRSLAVHPDGKRFAYSGDDGVIRIARLRDENGGQAANEGKVAIEAHSGPIRSVRFTPDGQTLISAGADNVVRLWDPVRRSELASFATLGVEPTFVCGTPNGTTVAVACGKKTVLVWNRNAGKPASKLPVRGEVRSLALGPTGMLAIGMADGDIQLWDVGLQLEIERLTTHVGPVDYLAFAGDARLVSTGADKTVRLWSLSRTRIIQAHRGAVRGLAVSEDGGRIVTGGEDRRLCVWSPDGDLLRDADLHQRIVGLALNPRRPEVALLTDDSFKSQEVTRWNLDEAAALAPVSTPSAVKALAYSNDGKKLAAAGRDDTVRIYDAQGETLLEEIPAVTSWASVRFGAADEHLIAIETDNVVRTYPFRLRRCFQTASPATCAAISLDGESVLAGGQGGEVRLWSIPLNRLRHELLGHAKPIVAVSFAGDGQTAFSADLSGEVRAWSLNETGPAERPLTTDRVLKHPRAVRALEASTSGATLVSGCDDGVARVWDVAEAEVKGSYAGQASPVVGVRLVDIERSLLACNSSGISNLWKRPTQAEIVKGASPHLAAAAAKSVDMASISTPLATNDHVDGQGPAKPPAAESLLRNARFPAEREIWRKRIPAAAPPNPPERLPGSGKLLPRGHVPLAEIGKGEPWDLPPAAELKSAFVFDGTTNLQIEMAVSSDGKLVAATRKTDARGGAGRVCVWDVPTGVELRRWESVPAGRWHALDFIGSNDAFVYTFPDVTAFELASGKAHLFADDCLAVPLSDREHVLIGHSTSPAAASQLLTRIDGGSFQRDWNGLMGYETLVTSLACSRDGRWAAVGLRERLRHKLVLFDLHEMAVASVLEEAPHAKPWSAEGPIGISDAIFSPDNKRLFWHGQYGREDFRAMTAQATPTGFNVVEKSIAKLKQPIVTNHVIGYVGGENDILYVGTKTGLALCEGKSGRVTVEINLAEVHGVKLQAAEKPESERPGGESEAAVDPSRVQYVVSTDGAWMASADDGGKVVLWDLTTPKRPCNRFVAHTGPVVGLRFSSDNRWLVTAGEENRLRLWNLAELQQRRQRQTIRKAAARP